MTGELVKELQAIREHTEEERKRRRDRAKELKVLRKERWLKEEEEIAKSVIADIPEKVRHETRLKNRRYVVLGVGRRTLGAENRRGTRVKNLAGAGKVVYDWCIKEGFSVEIHRSCSPALPTSHELEIFW